MFTRNFFTQAATVASVLLLLIGDNGALAQNQRGEFGKKLRRNGRRPVPDDELKPLVSSAASNNDDSAHHTARAVSATGDGTDSTNGGAAAEGHVRLVVKCHSYQDMGECLDLIVHIVTDDSLKVMHYLKKAHSYAITVGEEFEEELENEFEAYKDPERYPLHIPESLELHPHRKLAQTTPYGINMVKAVEAWTQFGTDGDGVRVCVMDTGLLKTHRDLQANRMFGLESTPGNQVPDWDDDRDGHGTHVTGTIAALNNQVDVVGVAPGVEIYTVRVFGDNGGFFGSDIVAAAEACQEGGANIISMSLGGPRYDGDEREILEDLWNDGILSVAAAGNGGDSDRSYPASYGVVISVAAVNRFRQRASFSQYNSFVDVAAPGVSVMSLYNDGGVASLSGTSMATPHVSGVVALMMSKYPSATPGQIYSALTVSCVHPTNSINNSGGRDNFFGYGIVDALAALQQLESDLGPSPTPNPNPGPTPTPPPAPTPTPPPAAAPTDPPVGAPTPCTGTDIAFKFVLNTDNYASETSWELTNGLGQVVLQGDDFANDQQYITETCIPENCYTLTIYDTFGDGLCCGGDGGYEVYIDGDIYQTGKLFDDQEVIEGMGTCRTTCKEFKAVVNTDQYGYETSHSFKALSGEQTYWDLSRLSSNRQYIETACIEPAGCFRYRISDSYGDGILGDGIELSYDGAVLYSSGRFGRGGYLDVGDGCD